MQVQLFDGTFTYVDDDKEISPPPIKDTCWKCGGETKEWLFGRKCLKCGAYL